jgi:hypothetical protein
MFDGQMLQVLLDGSDRDNASLQLARRHALAKLASSKFP